MFQSILKLERSGETPEEDVEAAPHSDGGSGRRRFVPVLIVLSLLAYVTRRVRGRTRQPHDAAARSTESSDEAATDTEPGRRIRPAHLIAGLAMIAILARLVRGRRR